MNYRPACVFAAIGFVVVPILAAAIADPTGKKAIYVGAIAPILLLIGILVNQWVWASSQQSPPIGISGPPGTASDLGQSDDYWQMHEAMAARPSTARRWSDQSSG